MLGFVLIGDVFSDNFFNKNLLNYSNKERYILFCTKTIIFI